MTTPGNGNRPGTDYQRFAEPGFADRYLSTFYRSVVQDEVQLAEFLAREYRKVLGRPDMLELGSGPCVARALQAVPYVSDIVLSDYLADNRAAIERWRERAPGAHDWTEFARLALEVEGVDASAPAAVDRQDALRAAISSVVPLDLHDEGSFPRDREFGVVGAFFCLDSACDAMDTWEAVMTRVAALVAPGGRLFASFLHETDHYTIDDPEHGPEDLYQVRLTEPDVRRVLAATGFDQADTVVEVAGNTDMKDHGYEAILMVSAGRGRRAGRQ